MNHFFRPRPAGRGKIAEERRIVREAITALTIRKSPNIRAKMTPTGTTLTLDGNLGGGGNNVPRWG